MFGPSAPNGGLGLVSAIARGRCSLGEIISGAVTDAKQLANRERCTENEVNLTLSLAFLVPQLVKAAVEGRLPSGIYIERLRDPKPKLEQAKTSASIRTKSSAFDLRPLLGALAASTSAAAL